VTPARETFLVVLLVSLFLSFVCSAYALHALIDATASVERTERVRLALERLVNVVADAETNERGYLLTGDLSFQDAFRIAADSVPARLRAVEQLTAANLGQQRRLAEVRSLASARLGLLEALSAARRAGHLPADLAPTVRAGRELMADLRRVVDEMNTEEKVSDAARKGQQRVRSLSLLVFLLLGTLMLGALSAGLWSRRRDTLGRERAQKRIDRERTETLRFAEEFVSVLGHDLRNPLGAIRMAASAMKRKLEGGRDLRNVDRILAASDRTLRMVGQLLDLTRSRLAGGIPMDRRECNLSGVVAAVVDEVQAAYPDRSIRCDLAAEVVGEWDPDRLGQVVSNLVGNAIAHGDPTRSILVRLTGGPLATSDPGVGASAPLRALSPGLSADSCRWLGVGPLHRPSNHGRARWGHLGVVVGSGRHDLLDVGAGACVNGRSSWTALAGESRWVLVPEASHRDDVRCPLLALRIGYRRCARW
jgi:signal transduction histidine kinase